MSTLICIGFGYSARHYVAGHGGRFDRVIGTTRSAERAAALAGRDFGGRKVEMLVFDGDAPSPALVAALGQADGLLVSAAPDQRGDPVLGALHDTLARRGGTAHHRASVDHRRLRGSWRRLDRRDDRARSGA